jgi:hypothetical protein
VSQTEGVTLEVESTLEQDIRKGQFDDKKIKEIREQMKEGKAPTFTEDAQGTIWYKKRICVPDIKSIRETILREAHDSAYSINPGSTKMYQDLKQLYWWHGMKRDVAAHMALCDICQRVKAEHQRPAELLQPYRFQFGSGKKLAWILLWGYLVLRLVLMVLKCHFQPSTILNNEGKLHALFTYLYH